MRNLENSLFESILKKRELFESKMGSGLWSSSINISAALTEATDSLSNVISLREYGTFSENGLYDYIEKLKELFDEFGLKPIDCNNIINTTYNDETIKVDVATLYAGNNLVVSMSISSPFTVLADSIFYISESADRASKFMEKHYIMIRDIYDRCRYAEDKMYSRLLISTKNGLDWIDLSIPPKNNIEDISKNYSKDFIDNVPKKMEEFLTSETGGIVIFRGEPGTGKSTYCKHLIKKYQKEINFLIVPQDVILMHTEGFRTFLLNSIAEEKSDYDEEESYDLVVKSNDDKKARRTVIIIEDCEKLLIDRDSLTGNNTSIILSDILNYSDGIIGDLIQCKFIFTFNTNLSKIDKALLRKGRMKLNYEFKKLQGEDLLSLAKELGKEVSTEQVEQGLTLAEIYNLDEVDYNEKKKRIGF